MANAFQTEYLPILVRFFSFPEDATFWDLLNSPFLVAIIATVIGIRLSAKLSDTQADANTALRIAQSAQDTPTSTEASEDTDAGDDADDDVDDGDELASDFDPPISLHPPASMRSNTVHSEPVESEIPDSQTAETEQGNEAPDGPTPQRDYRRRSANIAEKARNFIAQTVANDGDRRHQRTYRKISRANPAAMAIALNERGQLTEDQTNALIEIFKLWNAYSKGPAAKIRVPSSVSYRLRKAWERVGVD